MDPTLASVYGPLVQTNGFPVTFTRGVATPWALVASLVVAGGLTVIRAGPLSTPQTAER